jgi:ribonuclease D
MNISFKNGSYPVTYIEQQISLQSCLKSIEKQKQVAIDLEFDRNRYQYGFNLCLIQLATETECFIIDPLGVKNLKPLWEILQQKSILKIMHAGDEDMELLKILHCHLKPIFDTEIAARILNMPKVSLQNLLQNLLDCTLDKSMQTSNWGKRPLTIQQLLYSSNDVIYLHKLKNILDKELKSKGLSAIFEEECAILEKKELNLSKNLFDSFPKKGLSEADLYVAKAIFDFREQTAKEFNKPVYQVFTNDFLRLLLTDFATILPTWNTQSGLHHRVKNEEFAQNLQQIIEKAQAESKEQNLATTPVRHLPKITPQQRIELDNLRIAIFLPIKEVLLQRYGENAISMFLSEKIIEQLLLKEKKIGQLKQYQQQAILDTAEKLSIDLAAYL